MEQPNQQNRQIFRQESLDRISSPEQLNDYIRVANPSVWIVLLALLLLLGGLLVWSVYGTLETTVDGSFLIRDGVATCYLSDAADAAEGMQVRFIGGEEGSITGVSKKPFSYQEAAARCDDDYTVHMMGIADWNYEVTASAPGLADGLTEGTIITGRTQPISFLFN